MRDAIKLVCRMEQMRIRKIMWPKGLRRRWFYLMPAVFVTYSLAYLDRANYGFGRLPGWQRRSQISDSRSAFLGSLFFLGYFLFQIPGAAYARRKSATRLVFFALLGWGALASLTGVIREFWLLALDRLLLGVAESVILPAMLILLTNWFTRAERSRANADPHPWKSSYCSVDVRSYRVSDQGSWLADDVYSRRSSFDCVGVCLDLVVRDRPQQAIWLSKECCDQLTSDLELEQQMLPRMANFKATLRVPGVLQLCILYFCWSAGVYGFVLWLPTMIRAGSARGIESVGLLNATPFLLAIVLMLCVAHFSDRSLNRKGYIGPFLMLSGIALFIFFHDSGV